MASASPQSEKTRADLGAAFQSARREVKLAYEQARRANRAVAQLEALVLESLGIKYIPPQGDTK